ncbi:acyl-CoA dehydrogenase family protein [Mesorhizobium sp. M0437]|uniref:acyl-CoA dehydrogenase family protein n=1 Tax=Mesorhizobium sp. M0437 TaxID=2956945 RepID=UPI00333D3013
MIFLAEEDRSFRAEVRAFMSRELAPKVDAIERDQDFGAQLAIIGALGETGYLKLMFPDLYRGALPKPGLTHAVIVSEEAAFLNYALRDHRCHRIVLCVPHPPICPRGFARALPDANS